MKNETSKIDLSKSMKNKNEKIWKHFSKVPKWEIWISILPKINHVFLSRQIWKNRKQVRASISQMEHQIRLFLATNKTPILTVKSSQVSIISFWNSLPKFDQDIQKNKVFFWYRLSLKTRWNGQNLLSLQFLTIFTLFLLILPFHKWLFCFDFGHLKLVCFHMTFI